MQKFRKEKYIKQIQSPRTKLWSFLVRVNGTQKTFNEKDFLSASSAFKSAIEYRNQILVNNIVKTNYSVDDCYKHIRDIYNISNETSRKLDIIYNKYIHNKNADISSIKRADIIRGLNEMTDICSSDTIQRTLSVWKKIYGYAIANNIINNDVTLTIKPPVSNKLKPKPRCESTDEETLLLLSNILKENLKSKAEREKIELILFILFYTGMRPAELFALNKCDIDFKKKTITVNKSLDTGGMIRKAKTELSNREVPISKKCMPYIKKAAKISKCDIVFHNDDCDYFIVSKLGDKVHKIAKKKGIDFHFYQCRHTFITTLYRKGVDIKTIQKIVGQGIDATTLGYVIDSEALKRNAIELV